MDVKDAVDLGNGHKIEFGLSTWDASCESVRNRYPTANGGFSPRSSSELPIEDVEDLLVECARRDKFDKHALFRMLAALNDSLSRVI